MWLLTSIGFFSVVADRHDPARLLVRARAHEDLEALRQGYLPNLVIIEDAGTDYRFRAFIERGAFERAATALVADIDYPNFKDVVARRQGAERAHLYALIWSTLYRLQER